jgi:hypothetical protein
MHLHSYQYSFFNPKKKYPVLAGLPAHPPSHPIIPIAIGTRQWLADLPAKAGGCTASGKAQF